MSVLNVLIEEVIFGDILGINRTLDNKFSPHCSPVDDFNQIHEVLFGFEASYKFSVIRRPAAEGSNHVRAFRCMTPARSAASGGLHLWGDHCPSPGRVYRTRSRAEVKIWMWESPAFPLLSTALTPG